MILRSARLFVVLLALAPVGTRSIGAQTPTGPQSAVRTPQLLVFITIDQFYPPYFERYGRQLTGGLARLWRGGAFFANGLQDHAVTETAPGHASVLSGRFPRSTGIVTNSTGVGDAQSPIVGSRGPGASPYRFRGSVLFDWMRLKDPRSRALSVSRKDRGAILPLGRAKGQVFFFPYDRFATSSYYADTLPTWVQRFNARGIPQSYAGKSWTTLLSSSEYSEPDTVQYEGYPRPGNDIVFPHVVPSDTALAARVFPNYPWMDEATLHLALDGLQAMDLGRGPQPDLLAISLSALDAVGHGFGPDSKEVHDMFLRLDRYLGAFLDSLYRLRDSSTVAIAVTGDHGVAPYPEIAARRRRMTVTRAELQPAVVPALTALRTAGVDSGAVRFEEGILFVDRDALARRSVNADSTIRAIATAVRKVPGVLRVDEVRALRARSQSQLERDYVARRWAHMIPPDVPAELVVTLEPYVYWAGITYATHGSPHDYDAQVPVIFYGPWFTPGRHSTTVRVVDMAPTLAQVLNVRPTEALDGRVLTQVLRRW